MVPECCPSDADEVGLVMLAVSVTISYFIVREIMRPLSALTTPASACATRVFFPSLVIFKEHRRPYVCF